MGLAKAMTGGEMSELDLLNKFVDQLGTRFESIESRFESRFIDLNEKHMNLLEKILDLDNKVVTYISQSQSVEEVKLRQLEQDARLLRLETLAAKVIAWGVGGLIVLTALWQIFGEAIRQGLGF